MKSFRNRLSASIVLLIALSAAALISGCAGSGDAPSGASGVSDADLSSSAQPEPVSADKALQVSVGENPDDEIFLLRYNWRGEEFESEDSFQKIMMTRYLPEGNHAPTAAEGDIISISFDKAEGVPSQLSLMQLGNTVRSDSGLPYDTLEPELVFDGDNTYSFPIQFRNFVMYYYYLDCKWDNGNELHYGFALEKDGSF